MRRWRCRNFGGDAADNVGDVVVSTRRVVVARTREWRCRADDEAGVRRPRGSCQDEGGRSCAPHRQNLKWNFFGRAPSSAPTWRGRGELERRPSSIGVSPSGTAKEPKKATLMSSKNRCDGCQQIILGWEDEPEELDICPDCGYGVCESCAVHSSRGRCRCANSNFGRRPADAPRRTLRVRVLHAHACP